MTEHTDIVLWQHDFRTKLSKIATKAYTLERLDKQGKYSEIPLVADSLHTLYNDLYNMTDKVFTELKRLSNHSHGCPANSVAIDGEL